MAPVTTRRLLLPQKIQVRYTQDLAKITHQLLFLDHAGVPLLLGEGPKARKNVLGQQAIGIGVGFTIVTRVGVSHLKNFFLFGRGRLRIRSTSEASQMPWLTRPVPAAAQPR